MSQRTEAHVETLPPDDPKKLEELAEIAEVLDEILRFGTNALMWATESPSTSASFAAPIMTYHHLLGLLGGLAAQIRAGWIDASSVTLRSMLEAFLNLEFLVQDQQEERGCAFLTAARHERVAFLRKLDPATTEGQQYRARHRRDTLVGKKDFVWPRDAAPERKELEAYVPKVLVQAERAYLNGASTIVRPGIPSPIPDGNFRQLCEILEREATYDVYQLLSGDTHATSVIYDKLAVRADGRAEIPTLKRDRFSRSTALIGAMFVIWGSE
jgi:hypothetical protein